MLHPGHYPALVLKLPSAIAQLAASTQDAAIRKHAELTKSAACIGIANRRFWRIAAIHGNDAPRRPKRPLQVQGHPAEIELPLFSA